MLTIESGCSANNPAAGKAGSASRLEVEHHWPGLPEPVVRQRAMKAVLIVLAVIIAAFLVFSHAEGAIPATPSVWESVSRAFVR